MTASRSRRQVYVLCLIGSVSCAAAETPLGPLPRTADGPVLQEPTVPEHYAWLRDYQQVPFKDFSIESAPKMTRFTNLDDVTFKQLVRDGQPFVVDDCTKGFDETSIDTLQCQDFAKKWPTGNMRAEYTPGQYHIYMKDPDWYSNIKPQKKHKEHMAGDRKISGPYIWHVKDEEPLKTKREVQQHWRTPYFLKPSIANRMEANESFEFWFALPGGGTFSHADAYCETTISLQFRGTKRWRVQALPPVKHFLNATSFGDEQIYDHKEHVPWQPETEFLVKPGQCFVFPTGYVHETYVNSTDEGASMDCYTASTFQFNHPRQVNLYRSYLSSLSMSHYGMGEPCLQNMASYATLLTRIDYRKEPDPSQVELNAQRVIAQVEGPDGDGELTNEEIFNHFCADAKTKKRVLKAGGFRYSWHNLLSSEQKEQLEKEALEVWAEDALQYHDVNKDRKITLQELTSSFLQWHVVMWRFAKLKNIGKKKKSPAKWLDEVIAHEESVLRKFYCSDAQNCPPADDLVAHGAQLKKKGKGAISRVMGKIKSMYEERDGEDEELTMVDRTTGSADKKKVSQLKSEL